MASRHRWIPEHRLVLVHHDGPLDIQALLASDAAAMRGVEGDRVRFLGDHRRSVLRFGVQDVERYAASLRDGEVPGMPPHLRVAMLVEDEVGTALGMLFRRFVGADLDFDVFSTVEGACAFLGVDPAVLAAHADLVPPTGR